MTDAIETTSPIAVQQGAIVENLYVARSIKVFAVHEHEIEQLSDLNDAYTRWTAAAWSCITTAAGIFVSAAFQAEPTPHTEILAKVVCPCLGMLGLLCFAVAYKARTRRGTTLTRLKEESRLIGAPANPPIGI